jgi:hypothetical protein
MDILATLVIIIPIANAMILKLRPISPRSTPFLSYNETNSRP